MSKLPRIKGFCKNCKHSYLGGKEFRCNVWDGRMISIDEDYCSRWSERPKLVKEKIN